jgi:hypothetical protein
VVGWLLAGVDITKTHSPRTSGTSNGSCANTANHPHYRARRGPRFHAPRPRARVGGDQGCPVDTGAARDPITPNRVRPRPAAATFDPNTMSGGSHGDQRPRCFAAIAVGAGRVDIDATTLDGATDQMCAIVSKIDDYVEPRLPAA